MPDWFRKFHDVVDIDSLHESFRRVLALFEQARVLVPWTVGTLNCLEAVPVNIEKHDAPMFQFLKSTLLLVDFAMQIGLPVARWIPVSVIRCMIGFQLSWQFEGIILFPLCREKSIIKRAWFGWIALYSVLTTRSWMESKPDRCTRAPRDSTRSNLVLYVTYLPTPYLRQAFLEYCT